MLTQSHTGTRVNTSTRLAFVRFFISLALAATNTIWVIYLFGFSLSDSTIGFISAFFLAISLIASILIVPVIEKVSLRKLVISSLLVGSVGYATIFFYQNLYFFLIISFIITIAATIRVSALDICFRDNTTNDTLNKQIGLLYTILNVAWLVGPLVAGFFLLEFGMQTVFLFVALFYAISLFLFSVIKTEEKVKKREILDKHILLNIKYYLKEKKLRESYVMSAGLQVWWSLVYIYVPLFIINNGLNAAVISIFFTIAVIPLIISEYKIGQLADTKGYKFFFERGFLLLAITAIILFFLNNIYVELTILAFASFFAACIEPIQDSFFFKYVKNQDEEKYYPLFSTAVDIGGIIGKVLPAIGLLFLPANYVYLIIGALMFIFFLYSRKIKEVLLPFRRIPSILDYKKIPKRS